MANKPDWYVYILRCADKSLYTGVTINIDKRLLEHNSDNLKSARYTRSRRPVKLVYYESSKNRSEACKREAQIKRLTKEQKEKLVKSLRKPKRTKPSKQAKSGYS